MEKIICSVCGKEEELCYTNNSELVEPQMCHTCNFWREKLELMKRDFPRHKRFLADDTVYFIDAENSNDSFRGYGGARVRVTFPDGAVVYSTNLWCNGEPGREFPERLEMFKPYEAKLEWLGHEKSENMPF